MPQMKEALLSDVIGIVTGALTGTSTVTTFVESASGVAAGGRTGLTALTTAILFLACTFIAPIAAIIPAAATSSALIYVGILMLSGLKRFISYTVTMVFTKRAKEVSVLTYVISLLFLIKFFLIV